MQYLCMLPLILFSSFGLNTPILLFQYVSEFTMLISNKYVRSYEVMSSLRVYSRPPLSKPLAGASLYILARHQHICTCAVLCACVLV